MVAAEVARFLACSIAFSSPDVECLGEGRAETVGG